MGIREENEQGNVIEGKVFLDSVSNSYLILPKTDY